MQPQATAVEVLPEYRLAVTFADGTSGIVDCTPWIYQFDTGLFAPLRDPLRFAQVFINSEWGHLEWPNGADVDPYVLYEKAQDSVVKRARG